MDKREKEDLERELNTWLVSKIPSGVERLSVRLVQHPGRGYRGNAGRVETISGANHVIVISTLGGKSKEEVFNILKHELGHIEDYYKHKELVDRWQRELPEVESFLRFELLQRSPLSYLDIAALFTHLEDHFGLGPKDSWPLIKKAVKALHHRIRPTTRKRLDYLISGLETKGKKWEEEWDRFEQAAMGRNRGYG